MKALKIQETASRLGQNTHLIARTDDSGQVQENITGAPSRAQAVQQAAQEIIKDYENNQTRFKDLHIPTEILEVAQRQINMGDYPGKVERQTWIQRRIDAAREIEAEERTLAEAAAIERRRAARDQTEQEAQAAAEQEAQDAAEQARKATVPHQVLIGFTTPMQMKVRADDPARAVYLLLEWTPDDDPAGMPSTIERLTHKEALQWALDHGHGHDNQVSAIGSMYAEELMIRLVSPEANW